VRELEAARSVANRTRERATHVAEELALEHLMRDGAAVDGDERALGPAATLMNLSREELLAAA
jgi:hypothetical protein